MAAFSSSATRIGIRGDDEMNLTASSSTAPKKKRNQPGYPNPDAEVIALSPKSLMATNRFVCEVCKKGFQREQNLQLHRRGHNLPWKLKQKSTKEGGNKRKVYVCPEPTCVHHEPSRALGDLTGIKKHFSRKHGEKKWKCDKCSKKYAVQSDWKAHSKTCGTREYRCDCGTLFSRRDSFITHRAFCDALGEESILREAAAAKVVYGSSSSEKHADEYGRNQFEQLLLPPPPPPPPFSFTQQTNNNNMNMLMNNIPPLFPGESNESIYQYDHSQLLPLNPLFGGTTSLMPNNNIHQIHTASSLFNIPQPQMSATALLQKAAQMGATATTSNSSTSASIFGGPNHHPNHLIIMNSSFGALGGGTNYNNNAMIKPSYDDDDDDDAHPNIKLQPMMSINNNNNNNGSSGRLTRDFLGITITAAASQPPHTITAPPPQPSPQSFPPNFH